MGAEEVAAARVAMNWPHPAFEVPGEMGAAWRAIAARGQAARGRWEGRLAASDKGGAFVAAHGAPNAVALNAAMEAFIAGLDPATRLATRQSSERALVVINATLPNTVGGSADLTGSNNTRTKGQSPVRRENCAGDYIHFGIREHGMSAAMNGIALHGGLIPYCGTFLAFADYARPAMRLSALMGLAVVYVMTHDSIGLGEDGPTHQPVETLASLRAMPNMLVFRPADTAETAETWAIALTQGATPSVLALTRQALPTRYGRSMAGNQTAKGAYVLRDVAVRDVTLIATGSEVEIGLAAADILAAEGIGAAVVSAPCFELFAVQPADYRVAVLGHAPRVGASVEGELGVLGSPEGESEAEDGHGATGKLDHSMLLTDPDQAVDFVARTGVDALAIACGTSHGAYEISPKPDGDILAMSVIEAIHERLPNTHLMMHGSSSVPQDLQDIINANGGQMPQTFGVPVEEIVRGIKQGVRKVNIDTDCRMAMMGQFRRIASQNPSEFDPRKFLKPAMDAMRDLCRARLEAFGTAGQASKIKVIPMDDMARRYASGALSPRNTAAAAA